jgi:TPR repeat protein
MSRRRIGLAGIVLLLIIVGIWVVLPKQSSLSGSTAGGSVAKIPENAVQVPLASAATKPAAITTLDFWTRPPAKVAARRLRRTRFAELRRLGASEQLVDRLTDGDALAVVAELKESAQRGDPFAANMLADLLHSFCPFAAPGVQEAQSLPGQDADWLNAALQERIAFNKLFWAACQSIDQKEVDGWVAKLAEQGNGASLWLSSVGRSPAAAKLKLAEAADAGYPEAQAAMAQILTHPPPDLPRGGPDDGEDNLFKKAAVSLPYAESALAVCEFSGCPGIAIDIPAAVSHAREAAQRGAFEAMIEIGPQLQASVIDPTEVAAWNLVVTVLAQQGCSYGAFSFPLIAAATNTMTAKKSFDKARALADQYWRDYGAQIMSTIGCAAS